MAIDETPQDFERVPIERVRDFWDARPCNIRHSPQDLGSRAYFDEVEARKYFVEPHIPPFADFARWKGKRVLEIGCGIGTATIGFARAGARVTAVDLSEKSLDLARERARVYGLEGSIDFYCANAEELSRTVPAEPHDLIFSFGVIHHTPRPEKALEQIRAYVHPGSVLKVMVYHRLSWKALWILFVYGKGKFWRARQLIAKHSEAETGCPVTYAYTRKEARALLSDAGFRVTELAVEHVFPYRIPDYVKYKYVKSWWFRWAPPFLFRWFERRFGWHLCVTAEPAFTP